MVNESTALVATITRALKSNGIEPTFENISAHLPPQLKGRDALTQFVLSEVVDVLQLDPPSGEAPEGGSPQSIQPTSPLKINGEPIAQDTTNLLDLLLHDNPQKSAGIGYDTEGLAYR